jgi:hypothetical protein
MKAANSLRVFGKAGTAGSLYSAKFSINHNLRFFDF